MCLAFPCNDTLPCPSSTAPCRLDRQGRKIDRLRGENTDVRSAAADLSSEPVKRQAPKKGRVACILPATTSACGGCGGPWCTGATRFSLSICCSGGTSPSGALSKKGRAISDHAKHIPGVSPWKTVAPNRRAPAGGGRPAKRRGDDEDDDDLRRHALWARPNAARSPPLSPTLNRYASGFRPHPG